MKTIAWVVVAVLSMVALAAMPVHADMQSPHHQSSTIHPVTGLIVGGSAEWTAGHPTAIPGPGTYSVWFSVTSNVLPSVGGLAVTTGGGAASITPGCTYGAFVPTTAVGGSVGGFMPVTTTTSYCSGTYRANLLANGVGIASIIVGWEFEVPLMDMRNRGCAASAFYADCTTPIIQDILSGSLAVANSGGQTISLCGQTGTCGPIDVEANSTVSIGNATQNVSIGPGFWELFGPTIFALVFITVLARIAIWMIPGGALFGMMVAVMAFQQPYIILVLLQASAGFILTSAALWWLSVRREEFRSKRNKPRRFFDEKDN